MENKKVYEKPSIIDLNGFSASGQHGLDRGSCEGGGSLTFGYCSDGPAPPGGDCSPTGFAPSRGYCQPIGGSAVEGCTSGGIHT